LEQTVESLLFHELKKTKGNVRSCQTDFQDKLFFAIVNIREMIALSNCDTEKASGRTNSC